MQRREFFRSLIRYALLTLFGGGISLLLGRRWEESCHNAGICRGCASLRICGLPQALSARAASGKRR
ncbi:MAG TPA: hypothetical protein VGL77_05570 [Armatimonadota bacterium]|jgi:hypothetical protein